MKKLYNEYFYIPEDGKIRDKVMVVRVAVTVIAMMLCLFGMTYSAYAYFSHSVTSESNMIQSADYNLTVTVSNNADPSAELIPGNGGYYSLGVGTYSVKLVKSGSAKTGFCLIEVTVGSTVAKYYTQQIGLDNGNESKEMSFTIDVPDGQAVKVKFVPHWGTSIYHGDSANPLYIESGETIDFAIAGTISPDGSDSSTNSTETTADSDTTGVTSSTDETLSPSETESIGQ